MNRKPLKRHKALVELSRDHHLGLLLCWKIRTGIQREVGVERIASYVRYFFEEHLQDHFRLEEKLIFPCFPEQDSLRQQVEIQHQELYELSEALTKAYSDLMELLKTFEQKLEQHIRFEERQLFMALQERFNERELQLLQTKVEGMHKNKAEDWKDRFWE